MNQWEVWLAQFPFEDTNVVKKRPVIVLSVNPLWILSVKVTSNAPRDNDKYDIPIQKWKEAGLDKASTARISKSIKLLPGDFIHKLGDLDILDRKCIIETYIDYINENK